MSAPDREGDRQVGSSPPKLSPAQQQLLDLRRRRAAAGALAQIPKRASGDAPLSFGQQRLWLAERIDGGIAFNTHRAIRFTGPLNADVLRRALARVAERHEVLRTTYHLPSDEPVQRVSPPSDVALPIVDLSHLSPTEREAEARRIATNEANTSIDLATGPIWRATLLRFESQQHVLVMTVHHIAFDGWSMGVFETELAGAYAELSTGASARPMPPIQYADFAAWQRANKRMSDADAAYWTNRLAGLATLDLPIDKPRPPVQSNRGHCQSFHLPPEIVDALKAIGRSKKATLFMTLLAGFKALLQRYTDGDDIVVGTQIAGRDRVETEQLIGFFVNTLVLRTDCSGDPTFGGLLDRVRDTVAGALSHTSAAYEDLVRLINPARDPSRHALFQVSFQLRNFPKAAALDHGPTVEGFEYDVGIARTDLHVAATDSAGGVTFKFEYCTDLFGAATIDRMGRHLLTLLTAAARAPEASISSLPLMDDDERDTVLHQWNDTVRTFAGGGLIHERITAHAQSSPDAIAARADGRALSYGELNEQTDRMASLLRGEGIGRGDRVGLCCAGSIELAIGLIGILKSGAAVLPMDPKAPPARLAELLDDARPSLVLSAGSAANALAGVAPRIIRLDAPLPAVTPTSAASVEGSQLAYVMYTSGSTGKPNGVCVPHGALLNHNLATIDLYGLTPSDRVLQLASPAFDLALEEMLPTWVAGATVVFLPPDVPMGGPAFTRFCEAQHITVLNLPTAFWHAWAGDLSESGAKLPASLRMVIVGGEAASSTVYRSWLVCGGERVRFFNTYGPTEATIIATAYEAQRDASAVPDPMPIGRPITNVRALVLDRQLSPQPIGVRGELYLAGAGLAQGYHNRPELTAARFIETPFGRLYRTGDRARWRADGTLEFAGRSDAQVKVQGYRVEPGEIEAVLRRLHGVADAHITCGPGARGQRQLFAYVVAPPTFDTTAALAEAARQLPTYMVPAAMVVLNAFPLTSNGKVNNRALPIPTLTVAASRPPSTDVQRALVKIWQDVLGIATIGIDDNFFDLGGDSMVAVRLFTRIERHFGRAIPLSKLFAAPTVALLARLLDDSQTSSAHDSDVVTLRASGPSRPLFCVPGIGGHVFGFRPLAALLDDRPIYGLTMESSAETVEAIAALLVKRVRNVQPTGPYALLGYSFGGVIAFEMAQQLTAAGEKVSLLGLIDSYPTKVAKAKPLVSRLLVHAQRLTANGALHYTANRARRLMYRFRRQSTSEKITHNDMPAVEAALHVGRRASNAAYGNYIPRHYGGVISLFRSIERPAWEAFLVERPKNGWDTIANDVRVFAIPGSHLTALNAVGSERIAAGIRQIGW